MDLRRCRRHSCHYHRRCRRSPEVVRHSPVVAEHIVVAPRIAAERIVVVPRIAVELHIADAAARRLAAERIDDVAAVSEHVVRAVLQPG